MIAYGRQDISQADIDAVVSVLRSDFLTQGPQVPAFEQAVANHCHVPHAVAVNSATSGLHIACLALGLEPGDWLWTSPITFVASANCALYCGAQVDFVDIDPRTGNMCAADLAARLADAERDGRLPKIVVPVHFGGQPCDMAQIHQLSQRYGFKIIEDASHAIGATYMGEPVGNCRYSDCSVFSFHPVKIVTTAEGGVVTTRSQEVFNKMERLRSHGITRDPSQFVQVPHGPWYYEQVDLGFNYRMTELQAALGVSQMGRLRDYIRVRTRLAQLYQAELSDLPLTPLRLLPGRTSAWHLYVVRLTEQSPVSRQALFNQLRQAGIGANVHYIPVHLQPYYRKQGFQEGDFPLAETFYQQAITLPLHPALSGADVAHVTQTLHQHLQVLEVAA